MIEIDGVRTALELYNSVQADRLSDDYMKVLDITTSPNPADSDITRFKHSRFRLDTYSQLIYRILEQHDSTYSDDESVRHAYETALEQVDSIVIERIRND